MKKINQFIIFILLLFFMIPGSAESQDQRISKGHQLLQNKKYNEAKAIYLELKNDGYSGVPLFYNLGIALYENEEYPLAILYFEKALKLKPGDQAIQHNLNLANKKIDQDFIKMEDMFLKKWWNAISNSMSSTAWAIFFLIAMLILLILFFQYQFSQDSKTKKWSGRIFYPGIILVIIIFLLGYDSYRFSKDDSAAILLEISSMYSGPDTRSEKMYDLKAGSRIIIQDKISGWVKIVLINKETGWIENKHFESI